MKRFIAVWVGILLASLLLTGCGGSGGDSAAARDLLGSDTQPPPGDGDGTTPPPTPPPTPLPASLGPLTDLGDLVAGGSNPPPGDGWYFTKAVAINDAGIIVGQSNNNGHSNKEAFMWDPVTEVMTPLDIHEDPITGLPLFFDDFYRVADTTPRKQIIYSEAVDINSAGVIIGNSTTGFGWPDDLEKRAFVLKDGIFTDLANPPMIFDGAFVANTYSEAVDINEKGEVVLTAENPFGRNAYFWDGTSSTTVTVTHENGTIITGDFPVLVPLGGIVGEDSEAVAINENSQAVINSGGTAVFVDRNWRVGESLNHLPGATVTVAVDINDSAFTNNDGIPDAHVIGNSGTGTLEIGEDDSVRGFFWDGGAMYPVNDLGGGASEVTDLNNQDQVVGAATLEDGSFHAILWTLDASKKGVIRDLGTLGGANSFATAINEAGEVTGWAETGQFYEEQGVSLPIRHAFLWSNGLMFDLGTHNDFYVYPFAPPFPFSEGVALNASGQVAGNSITINTHSRGFFLSPVFP